MYIHAIQETNHHHHHHLLLGFFPTLHAFFKSDKKKGNISVIRAAWF
jgi:hypothetical protein